MYFAKSVAWITATVERVKRSKLLIVVGPAVLCQDLVQVIVGRGSVFERMVCPQDLE